MPKILINASSAPSLHNFRGPLIRALTEAGYKVHVSAPDFKPHDRRILGALGAEIHEMPLSRAGLSATGDIRYLAVMFTLIKKIKPDRVLNYTIKPNIWGSLAARAVGVPSSSMITGLGFAFARPAGPLHAIVQRVARTLYKFALVKNSVIFFQNRDDLADFQRLGILSSAARICMINGSGVDLDHYSPAPLPTEPVYLMISRLLGAKGIKEYASACRQVKSTFPDARFILVGPPDNGPDGISEEAIEDMCAGTIEYRGSLDDVRPVIREASIYVLPSYREGTPRSTLEAMAMGRPVVTTDAPGCRETVVEGENGFLVPVGDCEALAEAMEKLAADHSLRLRMSESSLKIVRSRFDVKTVNDLIIAALH